VVYDSQTKEPLDPVYLTLTDDKGTVQEAVSDIYGRYEFMVEEGKFSLAAFKSHYVFPSKLLEGQATDEVYDDLYFGQKISVHRLKHGEKIMYNLPMDCLAPDWNQEEKRRMKLYANFTWQRRLQTVSTSLFFLAFSWSVLATFVSPTTLNLLVLGILILVYWVTRGKKQIKKWGEVKDHAGKPLVGATILVDNLNNSSFGRETITNKYGKYSVLVRKGTYRIAVKLGERTIYQTEPIRIAANLGHLHDDLVVNT